MRRLPRPHPDRRATPEEVGTDPPDEAGNLRRVDAHEVDREVRAHVEPGIAGRDRRRGWRVVRARRIYDLGPHRHAGGSQRVGVQPARLADAERRRQVAGDVHAELAAAAAVLGIGRDEGSRDLLLVAVRDDPADEGVAALGLEVLEGLARSPRRRQNSSRYRLTPQSAPRRAGPAAHATKRSAPAFVSGSPIGASLASASARTSRSARSRRTPFGSVSCPQGRIAISACPARRSRCA